MRDHKSKPSPYHLAYPEFEAPISLIAYSMDAMPELYGVGAMRIGLTQSAEVHIDKRYDIDKRYHIDKR